MKKQNKGRRASKQANTRKTKLKMEFIRKHHQCEHQPISKCDQLKFATLISFLLFSQQRELCSTAQKKKGKNEQKIGMFNFNGTI